MGVQVSREPPPLPDGFVLGEKVYYTGPSETFEDPSETFVLEHGAQGEVVGRVRAGGHMFEGVAVRFPGSKYLIPTVLYPCEPTLPSLPGGYTVGEQAYYTGATKTFATGDQLEHGKQGEVVGAATSKNLRGKRVDVRFPGNKGVIGCYLTNVRRGRRVASHSSPLPLHTAHP